MANHQEMIKITGLGSSLGSTRITNSDLSEKIGLSPDEIERKTGIKNRFHCDVERENIYVLMAAAANQALRSAGLGVGDISGVFTASNPTGEFLLPNFASVVASVLGMGPFYTGGNSTGCSGGLVALDLAFNKLHRDASMELSRNYLVLAGDQTSSIVKPGSLDEFLFSDGASALVVTNNVDVEGYYRVETLNNFTFHNRADSLKLGRKGFLEHDGRSIYKFATRSLGVILDLMGEESFPSDAYLIPHQANLRIIEKLARGIDPKRVYKDGIVNVGNTSPASVFMGLEDVNRRGLSSLRSLVLATFGEGLTVAVGKLASVSGATLAERLDDSELKERYMGEYKSRWQ